MEAVVLAGGFGTRLKAIVSDVPKPMAPIADRPFLEILLSMLAKKGFQRVVLALGYMPEKISSYFGSHFFGMEILYEVEREPLGTGGAIRAALVRCVSDHVFVFNGDTYLDLEVAELERLWQANHNPVIVVREVGDTRRYGRVSMANDRVTAFLEKGEKGHGLINAGCYVFPKDILEDFSLYQPFSIETEFFVKNVQSINFDGFITMGRFIDIGIPEDYMLAQIELANLA